MLFLQFSGLFLAKFDVGPRDIVHVDRIVEPRLDEQPPVPVSDLGDVAITAASKKCRIVRRELDIEVFQATLLGVVYQAFQSLTFRFGSC